MKYHVGQVVEFVREVLEKPYIENRVSKVLTLGRIYDTHEGFAPQLDVRMADGDTLGLMESEVIRVVPMETIKNLMEGKNGFSSSKE